VPDVLGPGEGAKKGGLSRPNGKKKEDTGKQGVIWGKKSERPEKGETGKKKKDRGGGTRRGEVGEGRGPLHAWTQPNETKRIPTGLDRDWGETTDDVKKTI